MLCVPLALLLLPPPPLLLLVAVLSLALVSLRAETTAERLGRQVLPGPVRGLCGMGAPRRSQGPC